MASSSVEPAAGRPAMVIPVASGDPVGNTPNQGVDAVMYRGSRLTASFLLVVIGLAALAVALFVVPASAGQGIGPWPVVVSIRTSLRSESVV